MKRILIIDAIFVIVSLFIILHVFLPFDAVFDGARIKLLSNDPWYHLYMAETSPNNLFQYFMVWISDLTGMSLIRVAVWLPMFIGLLCLVPVYFITRILFNDIAAIVACLVLTVLPGEFLNRTLIGYADYHGLEVLLTTSMMLFIMLSVKYKNWKSILFGLLAMITLFVYWLIWQGAILFVGIIVLYLICYGLVKTKHKLSFIQLSIVGIFAGSCIVLLLNPKLPYMAYGYFTQRLPLLSIGSLVLSESGTMTISTLFNNFTLAILFAIAGMVILSLNLKKPEYMLLFIWTLVILGLTIMFRRYGYYLSINVAILCGLVVFKLLQVNRYKIAAVAVAIALMVLPNYNAVKIAQHPQVISNEWYDTLVALQNKQQGMVAAWWDYGYWIQYLSQKNVYCSPNGINKHKEMAEIMLSDITKGTRKLKELGCEYIIVDRDTVENKYGTLTRYVDYPVEKANTLLYLLWNNGARGYTLIMRTDNIKVYAIQ